VLGASVQATTERVIAATAMIGFISLLRSEVRLRSLVNAKRMSEIKDSLPIGQRTEKRCSNYVETTSR
ncbi:MAG: hypothetical protein ABIT38_16230, partial [Gemmatimonadaceae bacterium]